MNSTTIEEAKLQKLDSRLKFFGVINIGLMLILVICSVVVSFQLAALNRKEPGDSEVTQGIQQMIHELRYLRILVCVCFGLLLAWGPARIICLRKLKKLSN